MDAFASCRQAILPAGCPVGRPFSPSKPVETGLQPRLAAPRPNCGRNNGGESFGSSARYCAAGAPDRPAAARRMSSGDVCFDQAHSGGINWKREPATISGRPKTGTYHGGSRLASARTIRLF